MRLRSTFRSAFLIGCLSLCITSCGTAHAHKTFGLLSLRQGSFVGSAIGPMVFTGMFEATLTPQGACAWLGPGPDYPTLWAPGYAVRFHPTELIGPGGGIEGRAGQELYFNALLIAFRKGSRELSGPARCGVVASKVVVLCSPSTQYKPCNYRVTPTRLSYKF